MKTTVHAVHVHAIHMHLYHDLKGDFGKTTTASLCLQPDIPQHNAVKMCPYSKSMFCIPRCNAITGNIPRKQSGKQGFLVHRFHRLNSQFYRRFRVSGLKPGAASVVHVYDTAFHSVGPAPRLITSHTCHTIL